MRAKQREATWAHLSRARQPGLNRRLSPDGRLLAYRSPQSIGAGGATRSWKEISTISEIKTAMPTR